MTPEVVEETVEITEGKVVYEQDIRAAAHSNGRAAHLVESKIDGPNGPTSDDPDDHDHLPDRPPALRFAVGLVYIGAGSLLIYAGILVLRDWRTQNKKENT